MHPSNKTYLMDILYVLPSNQAVKVYDQLHTLIYEGTAGAFFDRQDYSVMTEFVEIATCDVWSVQFSVFKDYIEFLVG